MKTLASIISKLNTEEEINDFLDSVFTPEEVEELENRIQIVLSLISGNSQRDTADNLGVGIATVSRGARELKKGKFRFLKQPDEK